MKMRWLIALIIAVILTGCGSQDASRKAEEQTELIISAAVSLTDSLEEIKALYEKEHAGVKLNFNLGASGALQQQIEQGAPADLFLSAGKKQMNALVEQGLVDEERQKVLLSNELVVITSLDAKGTVATFEDLEQSTIQRLALGEPDVVPAGSYSKEALTYSGLWEKLEPKMVFAKDVRQVLSYVETGNVDAGFVYKTDALTSSSVKIAFAVDAKSYSPIEYPVGIIKATKHGAEAEQFYRYLMEEEAQSVFRKYGFSAPATD